MESKFTEQESLSLISEMIKQARNNFQKGSGTGMIYSGILVSSVAILNVIVAIVLIKLGINPNFSFWIWCLMIPGIFISRLIDKKIDRESMVKTHIDSIISTTWNCFGYSTYVLIAITFIIGFTKNYYAVFFLINPVLLILIGLAEFINAKAYRFKPYFYGAIIMWIGALASAAVVVINIWEPIFLQLFILAVCMVFGFVIPGCKLNKSAKDNV